MVDHRSNPNGKNKPQLLDHFRTGNCARIEMPLLFPLVFGEKKMEGKLNILDTGNDTE